MHFPTSMAIVEHKQAHTKFDHPEKGGSTFFPKCQCLPATQTVCIYLEDNNVITVHIVTLPIPVVEPYNPTVCGPSLVGIVGSNPARGMYVCLL
jgi:hypothetical protein